MINKYSNIPLYCQLKNIILEQINSGAFKENMKISSEQEFCERYEISRPTVRQAINELTKSGHLYKQKGKGTFVSESKTSIHVKELNGFTESILDSDNKITKDYVSINKVNTNDKLFLSEVFCSYNNLVETDFAEITYLIKKDSQVFSLNVSYIPLSLFPNICNEVQQNRSSFDILRGKYPLVPINSKSMLEIVYTDAHEAGFLHVQPGQALIKVKNTLYAKAGQAVELIIAKYRADKCKLLYENTKK